MATSWIRIIEEHEAEGALARSYQAAMQRAGRVYGIVKAMSLSPSLLDASMAFYGRLMHAREGLSRRQREMLAVVVSRANDCHY